MFNKIFNSKTNNFTFAAFLISFSTFLSAILGLLRDRLLAGKFGAGEMTDIYLTAFRIPDFLQAVLVAGGIGAAFLPMFSEECKKDKKRAFRFANNLLNCSLIFLFVLCIILAFFAPQLIQFVAPGFSPSQKEKTVILTQILFLSPILFCCSSIFSGILQYFDKFLVYSLAPILYNLGIIFGILFLVPLFGIYGLAFGVVLGALLHLSVQIPAAKNSGFRYLKIFNFKELKLQKMSKLITFSAIGAGFSQLSLIFITALSSMLPPGSITIFTFSKNLQYFPVGMIGAPFAIALFPALSRKWAAQEKEKFWEDFSLALRQILFLTVPLSFLFFILRAQLARIAWGWGLWGWLETKLSAASLGIFSLSLFASSLIPLFQKSFYSTKDTKTPTILQIFKFLMTVGLSVLFLYLLKSPNPFSRFLKDFLKLKNIKNVQVLSFPLALTISNIWQSFLLFFIFVKKNNFSKLGEVFYSFKNILFATFFMGGGVWLILRPLAKIFPLVTFWGVFFQTIFAFLFGILIYLSIALVLKFPEFKNLINSISKKQWSIENLWEKNIIKSEPKKRQDQEKKRAEDSDNNAQKQKKFY